jgi:hypothetical protein
VPVDVSDGGGNSEEERCRHCNLADETMSRSRYG